MLFPQNIIVILLNEYTDTKEMEETKSAEKDHVLQLISVFKHEIKKSNMKFWGLCRGSGVQFNLFLKLSESRVHMKIRILLVIKLNKASIGLHRTSVCLSPLGKAKNSLPQNVLTTLVN